MTRDLNLITPRRHSQDTTRSLDNHFGGERGIPGCHRSALKGMCPEPSSGISCEQKMCLSSL